VHAVAAAGAGPEGRHRDRDEPREHKRPDIEHKALVIPWLVSILPRYARPAAALRASASLRLRVKSAREVLKPAFDNFESNSYMYDYDI
jgi:hypothetical protein